MSCPACGKDPLHLETPDGRKVVVDACFGGLLGQVESACCGHGGQRPAYVRIYLEGTQGDVVTICGGKVMPYDKYVSQ